MMDGGRQGIQVYSQMTLQTLNANYRSLESFHVKEHCWLSSKTFGGLQGVMCSCFGCLYPLSKTVLRLNMKARGREGVAVHLTFWSVRMPSIWLVTRRQKKDGKNE